MKRWIKAIDVQAKTMKIAYLQWIKRSHLVFEFALWIFNYISQRSMVTLNSELLWVYLKFLISSLTRCLLNIMTALFFLSCNIMTFLLKVK